MEKNVKKKFSILYFLILDIIRDKKAIFKYLKETFTYIMIYESSNKSSSTQEIKNKVTSNAWFAIPDIFHCSSLHFKMYPSSVVLFAALAQNGRMCFLDM